MNISRRKWLGMATMAGFASRLGSGADTDPAQMIVRSARPTDLEMPLTGFNDPITPIERFFVAMAVVGFLGLIASATWMWFS